MEAPSSTTNSNSLASAKSQPKTPIEEKKRSRIGLRPFLENYRKGDRYTVTCADVRERERENLMLASLYSNKTAR